MDRKNKFDELRETINADLSQWLWFSNLPDNEKQSVLTEMAARASRQFYAGWNEGFTDAKNVYQNTLKLTA